VKITFYCLLVFILRCNFAIAQVPETGRWQDLQFDSEEVNLLSENKYHEILKTLSEQKKLDDDPEVTTRVLRIYETLIEAAIGLQPKAAEWNWELHTTSDSSIEAFSMAGGKLLFSSVFIRRLQLTDGELATLIGHEMAHCLAEHQHEELSEALHINTLPAASVEVMMSRISTEFPLQMGLAELSKTQEQEADQLGMILAFRAGWKTADMIHFFEKLSQIEINALVDSHPSSLSRVHLSRILAAALAN